MPTSLVTGGAGFIGSHVAEHLLKMGHKVIVIDDLSGGSLSNLDSHWSTEEGARLSFIAGTALDDVNWIFERNKIDYVFHLAAYAAEGLSHHVRRFNYSNNLVGSVNLINAAVNYGVERFVFTSSVAVYGAHQMPGREAMTPQPEDPYGIAKYAVELDLHAAHRYFGLDYTIFRPHNVYGERQNIGDKYRNVVGIFMNQALKDEPMTVFGDGQQRRAFSYVGDVAPIIARSAEMPEARNQTFNVGSETVHEVGTVARMVSRAMNVQHNVIHLDARHEVRHANADHAKARDIFGHSTDDDTPMKVGLAKMAAWVRLHGARETKLFANIEVEKNLPESWR